MATQIRPWEWARAKRMFLAGASYTEVAKRCQRSRSTVAAHGQRHKWEEQRAAIRAIRETVSLQQCLRYLEFSESALLEYVEKLNVAKTLEKVQRVKAKLSA